MIEDVAQKYGGSRKPYISLKLRDITGYVRGFIWNTTLNDALQPGKFILIQGKVETYKQSLQINCQSWQPYSGEPENLSDYVFCPNPHVIKVYAEELEGFLDQIADSDYRNIVRNACDRLRLIERMSASPYGFEGRLAYRGGLLMATVYLLRNVKAAIDTFGDTQTSLNMDLLIAGAIFRNIGWWPAAKRGGQIFVPGDIATLLGIRFASGMLTNHICISTESDLQIKIEQSKKIKLQQIAIAQEDTPNLTQEARFILNAEAIINSVEFTI